VSSANDSDMNDARLPFSPAAATILARFFVCFFRILATESRRMVSEYLAAFSPVVHGCSKACAAVTLRAEHTTRSSGNDVDSQRETEPICGVIPFGLVDCQHLADEVFGIVRNVLPWLTRHAVTSTRDVFEHLLWHRRGRKQRGELLMHTTAAQQCVPSCRALPTLMPAPEPGSIS
jgi:hypothetical protein